jgi:hypothetical protein
MREGLIVCVLCLASGVAWAGAGLTGDETPAADAARPVKAESEAAAARTAAGGLKPGEMENRLPPGFKVKRRGQYVVYCKSETPIGTRFKQVRCLDDAQMRDYLIWLQENKAEVDRIRATCSTKKACGQPDA